MKTTRRGLFGFVAGIGAALGLTRVAKALPAEPRTVIHTLPLKPPTAGKDVFWTQCGPDDYVFPRGVSTAPRNACAFCGRRPVTGVHICDGGTIRKRVRGWNDVERLSVMPGSMVDADCYSTREWYKL